MHLLCTRSHRLAAHWGLLCKLGAVGCLQAVRVQLCMHECGLLELQHRPIWCSRCAGTLLEAARCPQEILDRGQLQQKDIDPVAQISLALLLPHLITILCDTTYAGGLNCNQATCLTPTCMQAPGSPKQQGTPCTGSHAPGKAGLTAVCRITLHMHQKTQQESAN